MLEQMEDINNGPLLEGWAVWSGRRCGGGGVGVVSNGVLSRFDGLLINPPGLGVIPRRPGVFVGRNGSLVFFLFFPSFHTSFFRVYFLSLPTSRLYLVLSVVCV